jgi:hypothetical protein
MAEIKTKPNDDNVQAFLDSIEDERRREESVVVEKLIREATKQKPVMYGANIVGFGTHTYLNGSGKQQEWFRVGFSPRKAQMTLYIVAGFDDLEDELAALGPHTTAKSCLYIKRLDAVDLKALRKLVVKANKLLG